MVKLVSFRFQRWLIPFTICKSKGPLKREFLDIFLTTFFTIRNFGNTSAMRVIFFLKVFKILCTFQICRKKIQKKVIGF